MSREAADKVEILQRWMNEIIIDLYTIIELLDNAGEERFTPYLIEEKRRLEGLFRDILEELFFDQRKKIKEEMEHAHQD
jgi:hypothetical protein